MDFDAIETRPQRPLGARPKLFDDAGDLIQRKGARHREGRFAALGVRVALGRNRGRRDRRISVRLQVDMRLPADVPQLLKDAAALGVDRVGDAPPSGDLIVRIDAGRAGIAIAADRDGRCLRDDEAALRRTLGIILDHQLARNVTWIGAHPRQRRHHDAMG